MDNIDKSKRLKMPILDCLIDTEPGVKSESSRSTNMLLVQMKESVRRDLESLFNTRQCCISPPENYLELDASLLNYGLPDLATINLESSQEVQKFCTQVENTIRNFEPRIRKIRIASTRGLDHDDKCFRFRVEAILHASPSNETIIFDSSLDPVSQSVSIKETMR
jgi:type VI secretion system protein ImpF